MDNTKTEQTQEEVVSQVPPVEVRGVPTQRNVLDHADFKREREENDSSVFSSTPVAPQKTVDDVPKSNVILPTKKILLVLLVVGGGVAALFAYTRLRPSTQNQHVLGATTENKTLSIPERVAKLVVIPGNEEPSQIANISNIKKLSKNPFFANGQDGDVLLVYKKSNEAVLYRPSTNQIVAIGPVGNSADLGTSDLTPTPSSEPSISATPTEAASISPTVAPLQ